jgi:hypothetical protein
VCFDTLLAEPFPLIVFNTSRLPHDSGATGQTTDCIR